MVRPRAGTICVSLLIVSSGKFSGDRRCEKESHSESDSILGLWCVGAVGAVPFAALIRIHTSDELMLMLHSEFHWFQDRFIKWVNSLVYSSYAACTCSRFAGDVCLLYYLV